MLRLVISTVGTSLLTNQIRERTDPKDWAFLLSNTANDTLDNIRKSNPVVVDTIIPKLDQRAKDKLDNGNTLEIREVSAELNGIYGLYNDQLEKGKADIHWLIASDTYQGEVTAGIVKTFLQTKGLIADIYTPKGLSTASTENFSNGIDELLKWLDETIPGYQEEEYQICFNLVGGFKALQGYANTIGMLYGVEIIYVFETNFEVIKIPRLPIQIDHSVVKPVEFALMASNAGLWIKQSELQKVPETLIFLAGDEATLSNWGRLTWNNCKWKFLTGDLLAFPCLVYEKSFRTDFEKKNDKDKDKDVAQRKFDLQETLAEISASMLKFKGNTTRFDPRLHFTRYEGQKQCEGGVKKNEIDHFYIKNTGWRVSCIAKDGKLYLRHYGEHDYVNNNP